MQGELHEECGVFGVYHLPGAANLTYLGLHALQHRGQESAGIAVSDGDSIRCRKGHGLVTEALSSQKLAELRGENAVGHVRYSTAGGGEWENIQPLLVRAKMGSLAAVHNGQIANARELREELEEQGSIFSSSSDSEILLHLIQRGRGSLLEKLQDACRRLEGAFAFLVLTEQSLYAIRDCNGLRPLSVAPPGSGVLCKQRELRLPFDRGGGGQGARTGGDIEIHRRRNGVPPIYRGYPAPSLRHGICLFRPAGQRYRRAERPFPAPAHRAAACSQG